jgi:hypothetical protein
MERNMDRVVSFGQTVARTKVNFTTTILKEWGSITGVTKEYTKVSGKTTKWKAKVFSLGQMGALIKEIIKMIKRRVRVYLHGLTVANMMARGEMVNSTAWEHTQQTTENQEWENGRKERE